MEIKINVFKASVIYLARMAVAYVGAKTGDYDRLLVADSEAEMTESLWEQARSEAVAELGCLAMDAAAGTDTVAATVTVPAGFDPERRADLQLWLNQYFTNELAASWLAIAGRSDAERYQTKADVALMAIRVATAPRVRC